MKVKTRKYERTKMSDRITTVQQQRHREQEQGKNRRRRALILEERGIPCCCQADAAVTAIASFLLPGRQQLSFSL
jgi:hypothetical protein